MNLDEMSDEQALAIAQELGFDGDPAWGTGPRTDELYPPTYSQLELVPIDSIIIKERQRGNKLEKRKRDDEEDDDETLKGLNDSFDSVGFFGAVVLHKTPEGNVLVAGRRRLEASKNKGDKEIPAQFVIPHPDDPNPEGTLQKIELFEDVKRLNRDSLNKMESRAKIARLYMDERGMTLTQAADHLGIKKAYLSNTLRDADHYANHRDGRASLCKTQDDIKKDREKYEREAEQRAREKRLGTRALPHEILTVNFHQWALSYGDHPFEFLNLDFPWGVGQDKFGQKSRTDEVYDDSPEVFEELCATLEANFDRIVAKEAHAVFWFSIKQYPAVLDRLRRTPWDDVNPVPFAWVKPSAGIIPRPDHDLRQCYETAFVCTRGGRKLKSKRDWFEGDPPRGEEREHQSEKNERMMQHLMSAFVDEGTRVLDPTCGSGVAIRVAKRLNAAYALGLEISERNALLARAKLEKTPKGELLDLSDEATLGEKIELPFPGPDVVMLPDA